MKRLASSDSLGGLMSICHTSTGEHSQGYSRDFQSMLEGLDEEGCVEESGHMPEKKRRLSMEQVKALEKNFEVDNKLEPERKVKLAQELGLQPRQVAVWFQNRRARWKTKQLERDYGILKANYDALKQNFEKVQLENKSLLQEIGELKSTFEEDDKDGSKVSVKEETMASESEDRDTDHQLNFKAKASMDFVLAEYENEDATELNFESFNSNNLLMGATLFTDFKDGSSDESDSSAILNDQDNNNLSPNAAISSSSGDGGGGGGGGGVFQCPKAFFNSNGSSSLSMNGGFQFPNTKASILGDAHMGYQPQFVKIEEHNFFGGDESCSTFFSDDQPPSLQWDCPEEWN